MIYDEPRDTYKGCSCMEFSVSTIQAVSIIILLFYAIAIALDILHTMNHNLEQAKVSHMQAV